MGVNESFAIFWCIFTFVLCFCTLGQFIIFLSSHTHLKHPHYFNSDNYKNVIYQGSLLAPLIHNFTLLFIFVLQHSFQASTKVKNFLRRKGYDVLERLLYNCGTCLALQVLMYFWQPIPSMTVWEISTSNHTVLWWLFTTIHFISWLSIYSGCSIMDLTELLGVKQVYHYLLNWPHPLYQKSEDLKRFYSHMRHPSFSGLIVIFFIHPVMQIDRLVLAHIFTVYMIARFNVDDVDYKYQRRMLQRKYNDLFLAR